MQIACFPSKKGRKKKKKERKFLEASPKGQAMPQAVMNVPIYHLGCEAIQSCDISLVEVNSKSSVCSTMWNLLAFPFSFSHFCLKIWWSVATPISVPVIPAGLRHARSCRTVPTSPILTGRLWDWGTSSWERADPSLQEPLSAQVAYYQQYRARPAVFVLNPPFPPAQRCKSESLSLCLLASRSPGTVVFWDVRAGCTCTVLWLIWPRCLGRKPNQKLPSCAHQKWSGSIWGGPDQFQVLVTGALLGGPDLLWNKTFELLIAQGHQLLWSTDPFLACWMIANYSQEADLSPWPAELCWPPSELLGSFTLICYLQVPGLHPSTQLALAARCQQGPVTFKVLVAKF